jgi:hypothetical protein
MTMAQARLAAVATGEALGLALLSACADIQDNMEDILGDRNESRTLAFQCDDDREFSVRISGDREVARVETRGRDYRLEEDGQDNGRRVYSNDEDVRLTIGDGEPNLRIPEGSDYQDCERT